MADSVRLSLQSVQTASRSLPVQRASVVPAQDRWLGAKRFSAVAGAKQQLTGEIRPQIGQWHIHKGTWKSHMSVQHN